MFIRSLLLIFVWNGLFFQIRCCTPCRIRFAFFGETLVPADSKTYSREFPRRFIGRRGSEYPHPLVHPKATADALVCIAFCVSHAVCCLCHVLFCYGCRMKVVGLFSGCFGSTVGTVKMLPRTYIVNLCCPLQPRFRKRPIGF